MNAAVQAHDLARTVARMRATRSPRTIWTAQVDISPYEGLLVASTGFYTQSAAWAPAKSFEPISAVVPLNKLEAWLSGVDGEVSVTAEDMGGQRVVVFETANAELVLPVVPDHEIHVPDEPDESFTLPAGVWQGAARVGWAAERLGDKPPGWRNMVHVRPGRVFASDGQVLAVLAVDGGETAVSLFPDVVGLARSLDQESLVSTRDDAGRLHLRDGGGRFVVSTFTGEVALPLDDFLARARAKVASSVTFSRKELAEAVDHLRKVKASDTNRLIVNPDPAHPALSVETDDGFEATRDVWMEAQGAPPAIGLGLDYVDGLLDCVEGDDVTFRLGDERTPVLVEDGPLTVMLAPIVLGAKARPQRRKAS